MPSRVGRVVLVGVLFLAVWVGLGAFIIPQVVKEAESLAEKYPQYLHALDTEILKARTHHPLVANFIPETTVNANPISPEVWNPQHSLSVLLTYRALGLEMAEGDSEDIRYIFEFLRGIGKQLVAVGSAFFLALLFAFLIVLDLPRLGKSLSSLQYTKLGFIYQEVSGSIRDFGAVLGEAIQAQLFIALCNTVLTAGLIFVLGLHEKIAFLSLIVFVCSFIPVAGVFISSVPICLLAMNELGVQGIFITALAIWGIHLFEAYILNPKIYGARLRINPVLVLIILTVAGKLVGVWGLVLGIPICTYIFAHAIQRR